MKSQLACVETFRCDAEFFSKEFLRVAATIVERQEKFQTLAEMGVEVDASAFYPSIEPSYGLGSLPFLRVANVDKTIDYDGATTIPIELLEIHKTLKKVKQNDIVLTKGGSVARVGFVTKDAAVSRDLIFINSSALDIVDANFLYLYFLTSFANNLLIRSSSQSVQAHLTLTLVKEVPCFKASEIFKRQLLHVVQASEVAKRRSDEQYEQGETLLLSEIGIATFSPSLEIGNIKSFKESFASTGRLDAEHYQPKYEALYKALAKNNRVFKLGDRLSFNQRGTQPDYAEAGLPVINSKHVQRGHVDMGDTRFAIMPDKTNAVVIQQGDVLMNGTGVGTIGRAAPYLHTAKALPDNHVTILRTDAMSPICLALYLNSIAGQYQVEQHFKGSSGQIELYPADIANFWCPELDIYTQQQIDKLAQQSFSLKAQSERLLDAAKRAVEIAIEQNEAAGMAYLARDGAIT